MTTMNDQALILRDGEGNFYVITSEMLQAGRASGETQAALEKAMKDDTSGFFFDFLNQVNAINNPQNVSNVGANFAFGAFTGPQNLTQVGINTSNINASNVGRV
jgi:hypothetical protein